MSDNSPVRHPAFVVILNPLVKERLLDRVFRGWNARDRAYAYASVLKGQGWTQACVEKLPIRAETIKDKKNMSEISGIDKSSPASCSMPIGWECPRCGRINAPWNPECRCVAVGSHLDLTYAPLPYPKITGDPLPGQEPSSVCHGQNTQRGGGQA